MRVLKYIVFLFFFIPFFILSQDWVDSIFLQHPDLKGVFLRNKHQKFGFYANYDLTHNNQPIFFKSIGEDQSDIVNFKVNSKAIAHTDSLFFYIKNQLISYTFINDSILRLTIPKHEKNTIIQARYQSEIIAELNTFVLPAKTQRIVLVPLIKPNFHLDSLTKNLNRKFKSANLTFDVHLEPVWTANQISTFKNPESSRLKYTDEMIRLRNSYFKQNESKIANSLIFFIIPAFEDSLIDGFMVKNKAMGFIVQKTANSISKTLTHEYLYGYINSAYQLDTTVTRRLTNNQWLEVNGITDTYSYIDDYEDVVTNNGLIAYYLFQTDRQGNILLTQDNFLASIIRPMKKNTFSYHLQITSFLYKPLFVIKTKPFNIVHVTSCLLTIFFVSFSFIRLRKYLKQRWKKSRLIRFISRFVEIGLIIISVWVMIIFVDMGYYWFEVRNGVIDSFHNLSTEQTIEQLASNVHPKKLEEKELGSEIIIKKQNNYSIQRAKRVLYFKLVVNNDNKAVKLTYKRSSDSIQSKLLRHPRLAESHYMVVSVFSEKGKWIHDEIYNHLGVNLTDKIHLADPPKRILLFINGYRPTSLGKSFAENFKNIQENGVEFPNSLNRIYTSDRYNYWQPWGKIDDLFKQRINPTETFYADGHHSVATSNHRSILNFVTASQKYPPRCPNPKHHVCKQTKSFDFGFFGSSYKDTYKLLATTPNRNGFQLRENTGRIAGRNLFQLLNELPNTSKNDTLYIIAHSMGFAYAQGIINQLRGTIQFGGLYIIAPENAKSGKVNTSEWREIWQYGSNLGQKNQDAPCLQDGVAPQSAVQGLTLANRIFIPKENYTTKGFFDSHFIGYYKWILDIPPGKKGNIHSN